MSTTASAARRGLGAGVIVGMLALVAAMQVPVWMLLRIGIEAALASARLIPADATWNDGDLGIGLGYGGGGLLVVLGLGAAGCGLVARWAGIRTRAWVAGLAASAGVAAVVMVAATGL